MKVAILLLVGCFAGVLASDIIWMEILSAQIEDSAGKTIKADRTIPQLATDLGLTTLVKLVTDAGLADALSGPGPFTVFAPNNQAFENLPPYVKNVLLKNTTILGDILKYHVASGNVSSSDLKNDLLIPSLLGSDIRINFYKDNTVVTATGRKIDLNMVDQEASNGVVHVVDSVLFPPAGTITSVVKKCPAFSILLKAVSKLPDLVDTLDGQGPFTLFAPTDCAFKKIPERCLDALLKNATLLRKVLEYHVVPSTAYSAGLSCGDKVKTVEKSDVRVSIIFGHIFINYSRVTFADAATTNGVMHAINRVLIPRDLVDNNCWGSQQDETVFAEKEELFKQFF